MEEGFFQPSARSQIEKDKETEGLPLPHQLPQGADISRIPVDILRTSTVETLLNQNSDLMARLSVSLRKSNSLETRISELNTENAHLRQRYESIRDQMLVLAEKDRRQSEHQEHIEVETRKLKEKVTTFERRYADLYTKSKLNQRQLERLNLYRYQVRQIAKKVKSKISELATHLSNPPKRHLLTDVVDAATRELQKIRVDHAETQSRLVENYEQQLSQVNTEIELLRRRAADRDLLFEARVRIENQLVFEQRQARLYRDETQIEIQGLKEETADLRGQIKMRLIETERAQQELAVALERLARLESESNDKIDQIQSLQLLWKDQHLEVERLEEKNRALQKLNQQLSISINAKQKELIDLKTEAEHQRYSSEEKMKALEFKLKETDL